jgi:hypothetical protein
MLVASRDLQIAGSRVAQTPAIVPSFSSKGFPFVEKIVESLSEMITDSALVSAYDFSYGFLKAPPSYPEYLILDSGGYECSKDMELSDTRSNNYPETEWSLDKLVAVLDSWNARQPTFAVSFDHPKHRIPVVDQIARARELFGGRSLGRELLIKPSASTHLRVDMDDVLSHVEDLGQFDVIGFTEAELGYSIFDRMRKIARVRMALDGAGVKAPIHIFGSLDTISTPLYFLAGADVFDGLTWLRYSYLNGQAVYQRNAAAIKYGIRINDADVDPHIWFDNYQEIVNLQFAMKRYLRERSFEAFGTVGACLEKWHKELLASI